MITEQKIDPNKHNPLFDVKIKSMEISGYPKMHKEARLYNLKQQKIDEILEKINSSIDSSSDIYKQPLTIEAIDPLKNNKNYMINVNNYKIANIFPNENIPKLEKKINGKLIVSFDSYGKFGCDNIKEALEMINYFIYREKGAVVMANLIAIAIENGEFSKFPKNNVLASIKGNNFKIHPSHLDKFKNPKNKNNKNNDDRGR